MRIRTLVVAFAVTVRNYRLLVVRHLLKGSFQFWLRERDQTFDNPSWAVKPLRLRPVPVPACNVEVSTSFVCDQARASLQRARQHQRQRRHADNVELHVNANINADAVCAGLRRVLGRSFENNPTINPITSTVDLFKIHL